MSTCFLAHHVVETKALFSSGKVCHTEGNRCRCEACTPRTKAWDISWDSGRVSEEQKLNAN